MQGKEQVNYIIISQFTQFEHFDKFSTLCTLSEMLLIIAQAENICLLSVL